MDAHTNTKPLAPRYFAKRVLNWYDRHGRKGLPWHRRVSPYRVWLAEIMLQQTRVATVIPYFERFVKRFPSLGALSRASEDEVLHLWSGLGYYARARNLRRSAIIIAEKHRGRFPRGHEQIAALPGIGRSTAGAIAAGALRQRGVIADGNVKRVMARFFGIEHAAPGADFEKSVWELAEAYTPARRNKSYNQAMMDIGATLCARAAPLCGRCPLERHCFARLSAQEALYPKKKPKAKRLPLRKRRMWLIENQKGEVLLQKRVGQALWGGLWSLPEDGAPVLRHLQINPRGGRDEAPLLHVFSHFRLRIQPRRVKTSKNISRIAENEALLWYNRKKPPPVGLAAPITRLLQREEK